MPTTDGEILELFNHPDTREKGFRLLLQTYQERLYYHVRRYVHHHEDANDILQNTFLKIWKSLHGFRGDAGLYTWLYRIASNEALSYLQQQKKRGIVPFDSVQTGSNTDGESAEKMAARLQYALDSLPDKQKQVFIMRYYDEMSYEQMAAITDTSVGALKASYHHAVKKIEQILTA